MYFFSHYAHKYENIFHKGGNAVKMGKIIWHKIGGILLALLIILGGVSQVKAVDFKIKGLWRIGVGAANTNLMHSYRDSNGRKYSNHQNFGDDTHGQQRFVTTFEAAINEAVAGTVMIRIGDPAIFWGKVSGTTGGGALGADSNQVVAVEGAWLDFVIPDTELKVRMGISPWVLPFSAGGPSIAATAAAGITASYQINENLGLSAFWLRPLNDNYGGKTVYGVTTDQNYLDNMDIWGLSLPITIDGYRVTPWAFYGIIGKNAFKNFNGFNTDNHTGAAWAPRGGAMQFTMWPAPGLSGMNNIRPDSRPYASMFFGGLPLTVTAFDPLKIEFNFAYSYIESRGKFTTTKYTGPNHDIPQSKRADTKREGWLLAGLIEYAFDWAKPAIFGWYSSGDVNPQQGSGRISSFEGWGDFTSFIGNADTHSWRFRDLNSTYAGTWGIGLQIKDVSFVENLDHTFRVAWWGGTNDPGMAKYMKNAYSWNDASWQFDGPYMTTNDGLLEFNFETNYQMYENFSINLCAGYVANYMDNSTWEKAGKHDTSFSRQDIWKAWITCQYNF